MTKPFVQKLLKAFVCALGILLIGWLLYRASWVREMLVGWAGHLGAPAVPYLRTTASWDDNHLVRQRAIAALRDMGDTAVPPLIAALADDDAAVRTEAAYVFSHLTAQAKQAVPNLIEALTNDAEPKVRRYAARTLGFLGTAGKDAVPALLVALKEPDPIVRAEAAEALGRIYYFVEVDRVMPALIDALEDSDERVRQEAAEAFGRIGGPRASAALPALRKALQDSDRDVRSEAKEAIERIERKAPASKATKG